MAPVATCANSASLADDVEAAGVKPPLAGTPDLEANGEPSVAMVLDEAPREVINPPPADLRLENPKRRRMQKSEITPAMLALAGSVVRRHHAKPIGTEVEIEIEGKRVFARIERHFHPEGGPVKPWGYHPGVSLFVAR